jgi:hypothetical protein
VHPIWKVERLGNPVELPRGRAAIRLVERSWRELDPTAWDECVHRAGGSFLGCWRVLRARKLFQKLRFFEFQLNGHPAATKIGQCALFRWRGEAVFADRIYLLPQYDHYWSKCLAALVGMVGPNTYVYGSFWNQETPRPADRETPVIRKAVTNVWDDVFQIDVIATHRWPDFAAYLKEISQNIRRDYKKALAGGMLQVEVYRGWRGLRYMRQIAACRAAVRRKNGAKYYQPRPELVMLLELAFKIILFKNNSLVAVAKQGNECLSAFVGIEFGNRLYHVTGGTKPNREGAGSFLMMSIIKRLFEDKEQKELALGFCLGQKEANDYDHGVWMYRRKLRSQPFSGTYQRFVCPATMAPQV